MSRTAPDLLHRSLGLLEHRLRDCLLLLRSEECARQPRNAEYRHAVTISRLRAIGLPDSGLLWLLAEGFVAHVRTSTAHGQQCRCFRHEGIQGLSDCCSFVLTDKGRVAMQTTENTPMAPDVLPSTLGGSAASSAGTSALQPVWDGQVRKLLVGAVVVKEFNQPADAQEALLNEFQKKGWVACLRDPTPHDPLIDRQDWLHAVIRQLNRDQSNPLLRFRGDGTGRGVRWEYRK